MTRLLLTRPQADSEALATRLTPLGIECLIAPMIDIEPLVKALPAIDTHAILLTSRHGVLGIDSRALHYYPVYAVGSATADAAREAGFKTVYASEGGAAELAAKVRAECKPANGPLLYLRGQEVSQDMAALLPDFMIKEQVVYRAAAAYEFPADVIAALREHTLDGVLLFSPRTARIFLNIVESYDLMDSLHTVDAFAVSPNVARVLFAAPWRAIHVNPVVTPRAMVDSIQSVRAKSRLQGEKT